MLHDFVLRRWLWLPRLYLYNLDQVLAKSLPQRSQSGRKVRKGKQFRAWSWVSRRKIAFRASASGAGGAGGGVRTASLPCPPAFRRSLPAESGNSRADFDAAPGFSAEPVGERNFGRAAHIEKKFVSSDGTVRYLVACADGQSVETVWMPEGDGGEAGDGSEAGDQTETAGRSWERATICVSSQVGCAVDCQFCLTALLGIKRNLTRGRNRRTGVRGAERSEAFLCLCTASTWSSWGWASPS